MSDAYSTPTAEPVAPTAPPPPPPPSEPRVSIPALEREVGETRHSYSDPRQAARALDRQRRENGTGEDRPSDKDKFIDNVRYPDGRESVSAKDAAHDLNFYHEQKAQLLQELAGEEQAATEQTPVEQPQPAPEQQQATAAEQEQQFEAAIQHHIAEQVSGRTEQAIHGYQITLAALAAQAEGIGLQEFGDLKSQADVHRLAQTDPARFARFQALDNRYRAINGEIQQIQQQTKAAAAHHYQEFARYQDAAVENRVPELSKSADPKARAQLQQAALAVLNDAGFSQAEIEHAWHNGGQIHLRDARAQAIVAKAARWDLAQAARQQAVPKSLPPVQRPGTRQTVDHRAMEVAELDKLLSPDGALTIRNAVKLARAAGRAR